MKKIFLLLMLWMSVATLPLSAQLTTTVAEGTVTSDYVPFYGYYCDAYTKSQVIYPSSMVGSLGGSSISGITFYLAQVPSDAWGCPVNVYLGEVSSSTFETTTFYPTSSMTLVYTGLLNVTNSTISITFSTPYIYSGGNLILSINNTAIGTYSDVSYYGITAQNSSIEGYDYNSIDITNATYRHIIPKTTFTHTTSDPNFCFSPSQIQSSNHYCPVKMG